MTYFIVFDSLETIPEITGIAYQIPSNFLTIEIEIVQYFIISLLHGFKFFFCAFLTIRISHHACDFSFIVIKCPVQLTVNIWSLLKFLSVAKDLNMTDWVNFYLFKLELKTHASLLKYNIFYTPIHHYRAPYRTFATLILSNQSLLDPNFSLSLYREILCIVILNDIVMKEQDTKQIVGFDMGNSFIRIHVARKTIIMYNNILIEKGNAYINKKPTNSCLVDLNLLLSCKYDDKLFLKIQKTYNYEFIKGVNNSLIVKLPHQTIIQQFHLQFIFLMMVKGIYMTNPHLKYLLSQKPIKMIVTVFQGAINPARIAICEAIKSIGITSYEFVSPSSCIALSYMKQNPLKRDQSQIIGIIDFGDSGFTFTLAKILSIEVGVVEIIHSAYTNFGGNQLTLLLAKYVVDTLIKDKGMDISKIPKIMHRLKILCTEAKHTLSQNEMAFIRIDDLPDIMVYGCEISQNRFEKCILQVLNRNIQLVKTAFSSKQYSFNKIILHGGSCKVPCFRNRLAQQIKGVKLINSDENWMRFGLEDIKIGKFHILDIVTFQIRVEGDEKYANTIIVRGETVPLRKKIPMKFPAGQLNYSMRFYQNNKLVAKCMISERPKQIKYNLYVQVDRHKMLNIYATNSYGIIKMNCNMMDLPKQEYLQYTQLVSQIDFHNEND